MKTWRKNPGLDEVESLVQEWTLTPTFNAIFHPDIPFAFKTRVADTETSKGITWPSEIDVNATLSDTFHIGPNL